MNTPSFGWDDHALAAHYMNEIKDPLFVMDNEARIQDGNPAFFDFVNLKRSDAIGNHLDACTHNGERLQPLLETVSIMLSEVNPERAFVTIEDEYKNPQTTLLTPISLTRNKGERLLAIRIEDVSEMVNERAEIEAEKLAVIDRAETLKQLNEELEGCSFLHYNKEY